MSAKNSQADRREFIKFAGAVSALGALHAPRVFAQAGSDHNLQLALVGAGGRGTGAAVDALTAAGYPIKLVAMADVFQHRLDESLQRAQAEFQGKPDLIDVPEERSSSASTPTRKRWMRCGRATSRSSPRRWRFAGFTSNTPSTRGSMSSWRSRSLPTARPPSGCSTWRRRPTKRI